MVLKKFLVCISGGLLLLAAQSGWAQTGFGDPMKNMEQNFRLQHYENLEKQNATQMLKQAKKLWETFQKYSQLLERFDKDIELLYEEGQQAAIQRYLNNHLNKLLSIDKGLQQAGLGPTLYSKNIPIKTKNDGETMYFGLRYITFEFRRLNLLALSDGFLEQKNYPQVKVVLARMNEVAPNSANALMLECLTLALENKKAEARKKVPQLTQLLKKYKPADLYLLPGHHLVDPEHQEHLDSLLDLHKSIFDHQLKDVMMLLAG